MRNPSKNKIAFIALLLTISVACTWIFTPALHSQSQSQALSGTPKELVSYRDVVKKVLPAVVSIETRTKPQTLRMSLPRQPHWHDDIGMPEEFRRYFDDLIPIPWEGGHPLVRQGFGSGFVIDANGVIVTNHHVVKGADEVTVHLQDGRAIVSRDIKSDPKTDLAVIRIDVKSPLPHVELGNSSAMEIGDRVLAMGAPFGLTGSVSAGIVSGKGRNANLAFYEDFLQTDAAINPGNSGGPLVNLDGQVIGVNTAIKTSSGGSNGVGLAIPSNAVRAITQQLLKDGVVRRGYLGVQVGTLDPEIAARLNVENRAGVVVARVFDGSPAARAGLQPGDVITTIEGVAIKNPADVQRRVLELPIKKPAAIGVIRDGKTHELHATIEDQPEDFGQATQTRGPANDRPRNQQGVDSVGIELADLTENLASRYGHAEGTRGAVITRVVPGSIATRAGLRAGTIVTRVDEAAVNNAADARSALEKASLQRGIVLRVQFGNGGTGYIMLKSSSGG